MAQVAIVHNYSVLHEANAEAGIQYLISQSPQEARVFFNEAKNNVTRGAQFENHQGYNFTLLYGGAPTGASRYVLIRR